MPGSILTIKHWQVILTYIITLMTFSTVIDEVLIFLDVPIFDERIGWISLMVIYPINFWYPIIVGIKLRKMLSAQAAYDQIGTPSLILAGMIFTAIYVAGKFMVQPNSISAAVVALIGLVSLLHLMSFPGKQLKSIELQRNAGFWEYFPETVQFLFWPLGVFWLQPRINKVAQRTVVISE